MKGVNDTAPKIIYLQDGDPEDPDFEPLADYDGVTWCADSVNDGDTKYIRFDEHERLLADISARPEAGAINALRELVRLKDIHDRIEAIAFETMPEYRAAVQEYNANKPKAWGAARECTEALRSPRGEKNHG